MMRGCFVPIAIQGDFGKPRPALVIQSDLFDEHATVTVLLMSSALIDAPLLRLTVEPSPSNGLRVASQIMIDKAMTIKREKLGEPFGIASAEVMVKVARCLAVFLGIAK